MITSEIEGIRGRHEEEYIDMVSLMFVWVQRQVTCLSFRMSSHCVSSSKVSAECESVCGQFESRMVKVESNI